MKFITSCVCIFTLFMLISASAASSLKQKLEGIWLGSLDIPDVTIRLAYRISLSDRDSLMVIHDSPDYGFKEIPVSRASFKNNILTVEIGLFGANFEGKLKGETIDGK